MLDDRQPKRTAVPSCKPRPHTYAAEIFSFAFPIAFIILVLRMLASAGSSMFGTGKAMDYLSNTARFYYGVEVPLFWISSYIVLTTASNLLVNAVNRPASIAAYFRMERLAGIFGKDVPEKKADLDAGTNFLSRFFAFLSRMSLENTNKIDLVDPNKIYLRKPIVMLKIMVYACAIISGVFTGLGGYLAGRTQEDKLRLDDSTIYAEFYDVFLGVGMLIAYLALDLVRAVDGIDNFAKNKKINWACFATMSVILLVFVFAQSLFFFNTTASSLDSLRKAHVADFITDRHISVLRYISAITGFVSLFFSRAEPTYKFLLENVFDRAHNDDPELKKLRDARSNVEKAIFWILLTICVIDNNNTAVQNAASLPFAIANLRGVKLDPKDPSQYSALMLSGVATLWVFSLIATIPFNTWVSLNGIFDNRHRREFARKLKELLTPALPSDLPPPSTNGHPVENVPELPPSNGHLAHKGEGEQVKRKSILAGLSILNGHGGKHANGGNEETQGLLSLADRAPSYNGGM